MLDVFIGNAYQENSFGNGPARQAFAAKTGPQGPFQKNFPERAQDLDWEEISIEEIISIATTNSLLGEIHIFKLEGALKSDRGEEFLRIADTLTHSTHYFLLLEEKLLKKPTDALLKAGATVHPALLKKETTTKEPFTMFSITFSFAARDKKKLWLELMESEKKGVVPEAFIGMLHWKVRDMVDKGQASKYSKKELHKISGDLVALYHEGHRGGGELAVLLERYILLI